MRKCQTCGRDQTVAYMDDSGVQTCWFCGQPLKRPVAPDGEPYAGNLPPHQRQSPTSRAMAVRSKPGRQSLKQQILNVLAEHPQTDDELECIILRSHQSVSSARRALVKQGIVEPETYHDGKPVTRKTRWGNPAQVWRLVEQAHPLRG